MLNYTPNKGDTVQPFIGRRVASNERHGWQTALVLSVKPVEYDESLECKLLTVVEGRELIFTEFSDNIQAKKEKRY